MNSQISYSGITGVIVVLVVVLAAVLAFYFVTEYFFLDLTGAGWRKARAEFPSVAKSLGLEFIPPGLDFKIGEIRGTYKGYTVDIQADDALVELDTGGPLNMQLVTDPDISSSPEPGFKEFTFRSQLLNQFFGSRFALPEITARLEASDKLAAFIKQFKARWGRHILNIRVDDRYIRCIFPDGRQSYIPARSIGPILDDLVKLADILQSP